MARVPVTVVSPTRRNVSAKAEIGTATTGYSFRYGSVEGYPTLTLSAAEAELQATFAPGAGMIGCSLEHAGEELLELRDGLEPYARTGSTMGIPFLHPWANRLERFGYSAIGKTVELDRASPLIQLDENQRPIHGLLAGSPHWQVREVEATGDAASLTAELDFAAHDELLAAFPFPHAIRVDVLLEGTSLTIRTSVTATGEVPVPISFGYHPYLRLPGAAREAWEVELPVRQRLVLDDRMIPTGERVQVSFDREPLGERVFDDGFADLVPGRPFVGAAAGREIAVAFLDGYPFAQVYAPAGEQFICFEPMTAPTNALCSGVDLPMAAPGETFTAAFRISVASAP